MLEDRNKEELRKRMKKGEMDNSLKAFNVKTF
jgi:hypothetical protein